MKCDNCGEDVSKCEMNFCEDECCLLCQDCCDLGCVKERNELRTKIKQMRGLLPAAKEAQLAFTVACLVLCRHRLVNEFRAEAESAGIKAGFGVRLQEAITEAEQ